MRAAHIARANYTRTALWKYKTLLQRQVVFDKRRWTSMLFAWPKTFRRLSATSIVRQAAGTIFDQGLYSLTNFLVGVLLARSLAPEDYAIYVIALSVIMAIMIIQRAIISAPYTIRSRDYGHGELDTYTGSIVVHQVVLTTTALLLGSAFMTFGLPAKGFGVSVSFAIAAAGILIRDFVRSFLLSSLKVRQSVLVGLSVNAFLLGAILTLFIGGRLSIVNGFLVVGICSLIPSVIAFLANAKITFSGTAIGTDLLRNLKLGKWMLGSAAVSVLSSQAYVWMLALLADSKAVAILGVTSSLANLLSPLLQGATAVLLPKMVQSKDHGGLAAITRTARKAAILLSAIFVVWLVCGIVIGNSLLESIYSVKYSGYGVVLVILILYSLASAVTVPISTALDALQRSEVSFKSSLAALVVTLSIGTISIYEWGVYGAASSALLANTVNLFLRWRGLSTLIHKLKSLEIHPSDFGATGVSARAK